MKKDKKNILKSDYLHALIMSMSDDEKQHFFSLANSITEQSRRDFYVNLFRVIENQKEYDKEELLQKLKGEPLSKNLSQRKNFLYNLILQSLKIQHSKKNIYFELEELATTSMLLMERGLHEQSKEAIQEAKSIAIHHGLDLKALEFLLLEKRITRNYEVKNTYALLRQKSEEAMHHQQNVRDHFEMLDLYEKMLLIRRKAKPDQEPVEIFIQRIEQVLNTSSPEDKYNGEALVCFYLTGIYYHRYFKNFERSFIHSAKLLTLLNNPKNHITIEQKRMVAILRIHLLNCIKSGKKEDFFTTLEQIGDIKPNSRDIEVAIFNNSNTELGYYLEERDFERAIILVSKIEKGLKDYESEISQHERLIYYLKFVMLFISNKELDKAQKWNEKILSNLQEDLLKDSKFLCRIFDVIILYESREDELLDARLSTLKKFASGKKYKNFEKIFTKHLRQARKVRGKKEKDVFRSLLGELESSASDLTFVGFDAIAYWIENKIEL